LVNEVKDAPKLNGMLTVKNELGDIISGDFLDGVANGKGSILYYDGAVYEGMLLNSQPHGRGTMNYANGSVY
jgi:hypothetical protein